MNAIGVGWFSVLNEWIVFVEQRLHRLTFIKVNSVSDEKKLLKRSEKLFENSSLYFENYSDVKSLSQSKQTAETIVARKASTDREENVKNENCFSLWESENVFRLSRWVISAIDDDTSNKKLAWAKWMWKLRIGGTVLEFRRSAWRMLRRLLLCSKRVFGVWVALVSNYHRRPGVMVKITMISNTEVLQLPKPNPTHPSLFYTRPLNDTPILTGRVGNNLYDCKLKAFFGEISLIRKTILYYSFRVSASSWKIDLIIVAGVRSFVAIH